MLFLQFLLFLRGGILQQNKTRNKLNEGISFNAGSSILAVAFEKYVREQTAAG